MNILAVNLQRSGAITHAIYGNFTSPKAQEFVIAKGSFIELLRPDDTGKLITVCSTPLFSIIRSISTYRIHGANKDNLIIGSDSGKISIVEYDTSINDWKIIHCETFGKTGCRRIIPGQYLAIDPSGRAIMVGGIEKQKFVYVINRDAMNRLTISSPLEAHKNDTIIFSMCGVDTAFENPIFAMIELEYIDLDNDSSDVLYSEIEKKLTYYELDLGLNNVIRKWSEPISRTANILFTVPGGNDGPSGVLICGENWISYKHQGHPEIRTPLPRRYHHPIEKGVLITTGILHKQKDLYFYMLQSEFGDLYKVNIITNEEKKVVNVSVSVFDTIPPAVSLCITKTGLLFAASESGNHSLYQFQGIGDDPNCIKSDSILDDKLNEMLGDDSISASKVAITFKPSEILNNLSLIDDISSLAPITDMLVDDILNIDSPQILTLCGKGNRSSLKILKHGISVTEMAVSELPGKPIAVWTIKHPNSNLDRYIVVSFLNATLVLSIGDTVEEVTDSGILLTSATLNIILLADNNLLQIHSQGIRHIRQDKRVSEWKTPGRRNIEQSCVNTRQVCIALSGGEIFYFELDAAGQLMELGHYEFGKEIKCLDMGIVPNSRARSSFLAVGFNDDTVNLQLLSLEPSDLLTQRSTMSLPDKPSSLLIISMAKEKSGIINDGNAADIASNNSLSTLYLNIGLQSGVLVRVAIDPISGTLSDSRQKFLGPKSIKLLRTVIQGQNAFVALSTRSWIMYNHHGKYTQTPLSYDSLEHATSFSSEVCQEGIVGITGNTLRIITLENLGTSLNQVSYNLKYTPRRMCKYPGSKQLVIIETDHNEYNDEEKASIIQNNSSMVVDINDSEENATIIPTRGPLPPMDGKWASCIRIIDVYSGENKLTVDLKNNEAAFSLTTVKFTQHSEETFIIVGITKDLQLHPRRVSTSAIQVYRYIESLSQLQLLHQTEIEDVPMVMCEFQGKLLVGMGKILRLYDLGKKKLLKKCENKTFPTNIVRIQINGERIYVGDMSESIHFVKYKRVENALVIFSDDSIPRFITGLTVLDYATVACGDKFGNVFTLRLPDGASDDVEASVGTRLLWDQSTSGLVTGMSKVEQLTNYYLGEVVTNITKCSLILGGAELMLCSTIFGGLYAFIPLSSKDDINFFRALEQFLRNELVNLCGRDHLSYRSYYAPVKDTFDGDLCERFLTLTYLKQKEFADSVDRTVVEVLKKIEEATNIL